MKASLLSAEHAHPSIRASEHTLCVAKRQTACLSFQIKKVLCSQDKQGTNLLGVKRILNKYHPDTLAYKPEERGGDALESFEHLVRDFIQETGCIGNQWRHIRRVTEDKDYPDTCCGQDVKFSGSKKSVVFMATSVDVRHAAKYKKSVLKKKLLADG